MSAIDHLLQVAKSYGQAAAVEQTTVSWRVFGDSKKLAAIEAGSDIQVGRYEKALQWFSDNWPENSPWPQGVERPSISSAA